MHGHSKPGRQSVSGAGMKWCEWCRIEVYPTNMNRHRASQKHKMFANEVRPNPVTGPPASFSVSGYSVACCEQSKAAADDKQEFTTWHGISHALPVLPVIYPQMHTSATPFSGVAAHPDAVSFNTLYQLPPQPVVGADAGSFHTLYQLPPKAIVQSDAVPIDILSQSPKPIIAADAVSFGTPSRTSTARSGTVVATSAANEMLAAVSSSVSRAEGSSDEGKTPAPLTLVEMIGDGHCLYSAFCTIVGISASAENVQAYRNRAAMLIEQSSSFTDESARTENFTDKAAYVAGIRGSVHAGICEIDVLAESLGVGICALFSSSDGRASKRLMPDKLLFTVDRKKLRWGIVIRSVLQKSKHGHYNVLCSGDRFLLSYDELLYLTRDVTGLVRRHSLSPLSGAPLTSEEFAPGKGLFGRCYLHCHLNLYSLFWLQCGSQSDPIN